MCPFRATRCSGENVYPLVFLFLPLKLKARRLFSAVHPRRILAFLVFSAVFTVFIYEQWTAERHARLTLDRRRRAPVLNQRPQPRIKNRDVSKYSCDKPWALRNDPKLVVAYIQSSSYNAERRNLIRNTLRPRRKFRIQPLFVIGQNYSHVKHPEYLLDLQREACDFGDILYIPDVRDHRDNFTLIEIRAKRWIMESVSRTKYVLKADDAFFVNMTTWLTEFVVLFDTLTLDRNCSDRTRCLACELWLDYNLTGILEDWSSCLS